MYILKNDRLEAAFSENGVLLSLRKGQEPNIIVTPEKDAFRMVFELGACKETFAMASMQQFTVQEEPNGLRITVPQIQARKSATETVTLNVRLSMHISLQEDVLSYTAEIDNQSEARLLEFEYPRIGHIHTLQTEPMALLVPNQCGLRYQNIAKELKEASVNRECESNNRSFTYPGDISMPWLALTDNEQTLFFTAYDRDFHVSALRVYGFPKEAETVRLDVTRMLCLPAGEKATVDETTLAFYNGDWHRGVKAYADWMRPYRPMHQKPDWIRRMNGYFLVINNQQFGYEMWPYASLPKLYEMAQAHGCDTLGLFGWYATGHDNNYPDLSVSESLGGAQALKENIKAVQNAGGHVTLYYQGHLIDETSPFYQSGAGERVTAKNIWGSAYVEFYNKSHQSSVLRHFSRKVFRIACPAAKEWQQLMLEREDWLAEFGADGVLYDQIGGVKPYLCFDPRHQHNPAMAFTTGRRQLLGALQTHGKEISPNFAFFSEHINDLYSAYLDAIHGIGATTGAINAFATMSASPETVQCLNYPAMFRYAFPETVITVRNTNPFIPKRTANYAVVYGFRLEMEIRYQADREDVLADFRPEDREWAAKITALRNTYADTLLLGTYCDRDELLQSDSAVQTGCFVQGNRMTVALFNDNTAARPLLLQTKPEWHFTGGATPENTHLDWPQKLDAGELCILNFER